jgi:hypothetical protein
VTVKTGQSGVDANVILCIFGDEETTTNLPLRQTSDGVDVKFTTDSTAEFNLKAVDVGKVSLPRRRRSPPPIDHVFSSFRSRKSILVTMAKALTSNGFSNRSLLRRKVNFISKYDRSASLRFDVGTRILFRFKAHRWLGEEKEDHKTYIDLLPMEDQPPSSSPVVAKGRD